MQFDKLVYRESGCPDRGSVLTVDFGGIGEITAESEARHEVNWRRITRPLLDVLLTKLEACDFEAWRDEYSMPDSDGFGWGLELFEDGKSVKRMSGGTAVPEQWPAFQSILELCGALAENRSKREARPMPNKE